MDERNNLKLEKIKQSLLSLNNEIENDETKKENILKENNKELLKGNFRKGMELKK